MVLENCLYNRFVTLPTEKAKALVKQLHFAEKDTTISILNSSQPNIVIILLESWSGDLIESIGGEAGITSEFRKIFMISDKHLKNL